MNSPALRRIHLRVGPDAFLPAQLALADDGGWFGAAELDELLALLHDELPRRLPEALKAQAPTPPVVCRGDTVQACLTFLPTDGGEVLFAAAATEGYTAVACTLLLHADRYDADAPRLPRGCPGAATLAAAPATAVMEDFFPAAGGAPAPAAAKRRRGGGGGAGEWTCSACTLVNAARASRCEACAQPRPGGAAARRKPADPQLAHEPPAEWSDDDAFS